MTPTALLDTLAARGVSIRADGGALKLKPMEAIPDLLPEIRQLKPALLEFLSHSPLMQEMLTAHPELNNPADVAELLEYFDEWPLLPTFTSAYCDEMRDKARVDELQLSQFNDGGTNG
jgi:hypothetical protein